MQHIMLCHTVVVTYTATQENESVKRPHAYDGLSFYSLEVETINY